MQTYSPPDKVPSSFSGIPIKSHPAFLSNFNCLWSMINIFYGSSSYRSRLPYFERNMVQDNWLLFLIYNFPYLQYTISTVLLLIHLNSETTSQHPTGLIDSRRHDLIHSRSDCVNRIYYLCGI